MQVNKIAVIGSGVMGSGIAAQAANGGLDVMLLDIVPEGAQNRNQLAEQAIEKQKKSGGFAHPSCAMRVSAGNLEDDIDKLAQVDWIIEVVVEKIEVKHKVYRQIEAARRPGSIVSSNTSTIPLAKLMEPMPESFQNDFMIAHFFNPPRLMRLIEMVPSPSMEMERYRAICHIADTVMGKTIVHCKDTPGFIANRIGVYWLTLAMNKAIEHGMRLEAVDQLLGKPVGVPKTAVFGLYDLIGIDLMPLIAEALSAYTDSQDAFNQLEPKPDVVKQMIAGGYTGRKGKGGFYKMEKLENGDKTLYAMDLTTGEYHPAITDAILASSNSKNIAQLLAHEDMGGQFAREVMVRSLHYAASLAGEIADDVYSIDQAMRHGYSWKYGPFELIDQIGVNQFATYCTQLRLPVPKIIEQANGRPIYHGAQQLTTLGSYTPVPRPHGTLRLGDHGEPVCHLDHGNVWDMGDGVYCLETTTKMHTIDEGVLGALDAALDYATANAKALVIGSEDALFSAGANLHAFLDNARSGKLAVVDALIAHGQRIMQKIKHAPIPVVPALTGFAVGGGCELLLHTRGVQAHLECHVGLVEVNVGVVPAWGGCTQMLLRRVMVERGDANQIAALVKLYADIVHAKVARSAYEAMDMAIINGDTHITMNPDRLLADAKQAALQLVGMHPLDEQMIHLPKGSKAALDAWLSEHQAAMAPHTRHIAGRLAELLTLAEAAPQSEHAMLDKEREIFMELLATPATQERIEHMLETGKPLLN